MVYKFVKTRTLQWCDGCGRAIYEGEIAWAQGGARDDYRYVCIDCIRKEAIGKVGLNQEILDCKICRDERIIRPLHGAGNHKADIVIVGQNTCQPKCLEDGIPFSGGSGVLLVDALTAAKLTREDVYITNVVKCATVGNLIPTAEMKQNCQSFLIRELRILKPKLVITLGKFAAENFPKGDYVVKNLLHPAWYMRKGNNLEFVKKFLEVIKDGR